MCWKEWTFGFKVTHDQVVDAEQPPLPLGAATTYNGCPAVVKCHGSAGTAHLHYYRYWVVDVGHSCPSDNATPIAALFLGIGKRCKRN